MMRRHRARILDAGGNAMRVLDLSRSVAASGERLDRFSPRRRPTSRVAASRD